MAYGEPNGHVTDDVTIPTNTNDCEYCPWSYNSMVLSATRLIFKLTRDGVAILR